MARIKLIEFKNILDVLGISATSKCDYVKMGKPGNETLIEIDCIWNGLKIWYNANQCIVNISGSIPLELAENICKNNYERGLTWWSYATETAGYSIQKSPYKTDPQKIATCDEFKGWIEDEKKRKGRDCTVLVYIPQNMITSKRQELVNQDPSNAYIESFTFENKEGLMIFFTELQEYYTKKQQDNKAGLDTSLRKRQAHLLGDVIQASLDIVKPQIGPREWIKEQQSTILDETINRSGSNDQERKLRTILTVLDNTISPYLDDSREVLPPQDTCDKVDISCFYGVDFMESGPVKARMSIEDKKNNSAWYVRSSDEMTLSLHYDVSEYISVRAVHCYSKRLENESINVTVQDTRWVNDSPLPPIISITYNLTTNTGIVVRKGKKEEMSPRNIEVLIKLLQAVIANGEKITTNNMTTGGRQKTAEPVS